MSLSSDLLEEVKDVLIPAEMLRIEEKQIIGKGEFLDFFACIFVFFASTTIFIKIFFFLLFHPTIFYSHTGHFGTVYHGYLIDSNKQETHCAVKSLNSKCV